MMRRLLSLLLAISLPAALPAQLETGADASGNSTNAFDNLLIKPNAFSTTPAGDTQPNVSPPATAPLETRTPAQLQAILAGYVGHWTGNYVVATMNGGEASRTPIDVVYTMETDQAGNHTLVGKTTYTTNGKKSIEVTHSWVDPERKQILAEIAHDGITEKFFAVTRDADLVWFTHDSNKGATDFSMTESLRLTMDGGTLTSKGFEAVPGTKPTVLVFVTSQLTKQPQ